jgi:RNA polymerase sigma-70 factor (ECF subfamily)
MDRWRDLFVAEYPRLAGWARRLVDDDETAQEIAAEAFTRLMARWQRPDNPHAFLYKVATNLVRDHWRRDARRRRALVTAAGGHRDVTVVGVGHDAELRALLAELTDRQRTAVVLHYLAGFSVREVAELERRPEGTVKSDLYQARRRLRTLLETRP